MQVKKDFILREIGGQPVVVALGEMSRTLHGIIQLNQTGAFLWQQLQAEITTEALVSCFAQEYALELQRAQQDVGAFLNQMRENGFLAE